MAGQVFMTVRPRSSTVDGRQRLWMPLLDGTERLGVLEVGLGDGGSADDPGLLAGCDLFSQLLGHLVATKMPYGNALLQVRRQRRMSEASELLWRLQPPMTFVSERAVVSAVLEPCYEVHPPEQGGPRPRRRQAAPAGPRRGFGRGRGCRGAAGAW
ncbi:hypothetical protein [Dactylosporangium sp. NPDC006015]|uniref:hypothetical protein n=1 Tax=Dactylosporangium sp. NPDC006015 TaxID=3154576 RepID=UPI0033BFA9F1